MFAVWVTEVPDVCLCIWVPVKILQPYTQGWIVFELEISI